MIDNELEREKFVVSDVNAAPKKQNSSNSDNAANINIKNIVFPSATHEAAIEKNTDNDHNVHNNVHQSPKVSDVSIDTNANAVKKQENEQPVLKNRSKNFSASSTDEDTAEQLLRKATGLNENKKKTDGLNVDDDDEFNDQDYDSDDSEYIRRKQARQQQLQKTKNPIVLARRYYALYSTKMQLLADFIDTDPRRKRVQAILQSASVTTFMTIVTLWALFSDDFRILVAPPSFDDAFGIIAFFVLLSFTLELIVSCYCIPNYFLSFFFLLDLIAAVSVIFDVQFIVENTELDSNASATEARAGRAARAGTRAGRIIRLIRLIRLTTLFKSTMCCFRKNQSQDEAENEEQDFEEFEDNKEYQPTKLGAFLSQLMTKKVICGVLIMIFVLPQLQPADREDNVEIMPSLQRLHDWSQDTTTNTQTQIDLLINNFKDEYDKTSLTKNLVFLKVNNVEYLNRQSTINNLRVKEIETFLISGDDIESAVTSAVFDTKDIALDDAAKSIGNTIFLIFMLAALALAFTQDTEKYVVTPIRNMTDAIRNLATYDKAISIIEKQNKKKLSRRNTIQKLIDTRRQSQMPASFAGTVANDTSDNDVITQMENDENSAGDGASGGGASNATSDKKSNAAGAETGLETDMMQGTIRKLARLLELGFGVAGQQIVRKVIAQADTDANNGDNGHAAAQDIDFTQTGGDMINAIFGFCIIRDFNTTLQVLQGEIMIYVNKIAAIVHNIVHEHSGAANKNIGNAFLCVWKLPEEESMNEEKLLLQKQNLADQALLGFLKIIIAIHENEEIQRYAQIPELKQLLPDFKVELGFGLHCGWGIEGAIGSKHKIDASYLSPNVNLAARLESGTHQFGVDILVSDAFVQLLSPTARKFCRQIDHVCVKGSAVPMGLWTYDLNLELPSPQKNDNDNKEMFQPINNDTEQNTEKEEPESKENDNENQDVLQIHTPISKLLTDDKDNNSNKNKQNGQELTKFELAFMNDPLLLKYRSRSQPQFYSIFKNAFLHYIEGNWQNSKEELEKGIKLVPNDGPTKVLMNVMAKSDFQAPQDWGGHRSLTSK